MVEEQEKTVNMTVPKCCAIPPVRPAVTFHYVEEKGWVGNTTQFICDKGRREVTLTPAMPAELSETSGCKGCLFFNGDDNTQS